MWINETRIYLPINGWILCFLWLSWKITQIQKYWKNFKLNRNQKKEKLENGKILQLKTPIVHIHNEIRKKSLGKNWGMEEDQEEEKNQDINQREWDRFQKRHEH